MRQPSIAAIHTIRAYSSDGGRPVSAYALGSLHGREAITELIAEGLAEITQDRKVVFTTLARQTLFGGKLND